MCFAVFAWLGLTSWPGQFVIGFLAEPTILNFFRSFVGYDLIIVVLFWGSRPTLWSQRVVIGFWPISTFIHYWALEGQVQIDLLGGQGIGAVTLFGMGMAIPAGIAFLGEMLRPVEPANEEFERNKRWLFVLTLLFTLIPQSALDFTVALHPRSYDAFALHFDSSAGLNITAWLTDQVNLLPGLSEILGLAYGFTPLAFSAICLLQLRGKRLFIPNALLLWVVMSLSALIAYHLFPITGPKYIFGAEQYITKLRSVTDLPLALTSSVGPNPRNGMPSMHFGWMLAATILWIRSDTAWWSRTILVVMTVCVAAATLYLGEHYAIDLIVATPFVLACIALTTTGVSWGARERWLPVAFGVLTWLIWVLLLRTQIRFFIDYPIACWVLIGSTAMVVGMQAHAMARYRALAEAHSCTAMLPSGVDTGEGTFSDRQLKRQMGLMFFASGAAALVYQVLFAKELTLVFGSTATATFTVLATFLGGMALGSLIGAKVASRVNRPLAVYAFVELGIAGFCALTPKLFSLLQGAYIFLAADISPASPVLLILRVALGSGVLLLPTLLMGITLPLLVRALDASRTGAGSAVAWLYTCNTAGAAIGAVLTSYFVIPLLGAQSTTLVAALLNLLVALGALELAKNRVLHSQYSRTHADRTEMEDQNAQANVRAHIAALVALGVGGLLSLGLEVVYVHLLSVVAGNSVYAFGLMLATFLIGLAAGGEAGRRLILSANNHRAVALAGAQIFLAVTVALGTWGWDQIPAYFASYEGYPVATSFSAREGIRALVCALVMIPPTLCIGLSYAIAMDLAASAGNNGVIRTVGLGAAVNTLGNIVGVLFFGFFLLPLLGGMMSSKLIALGALMLALFVGIMAVPKRQWQWLGGGLAGGVLCVGLGPVGLDYDLLSSGANVYFYPQAWGKVVDHAESIDGGLTTVTKQQSDSGAITTLLTNGKFQGNDARKGEVQAQIGFAALPLLHQEQRDAALVIGYGTGGTSRVFRDAGFAHIDIAELSQDVVNLADKHFSEINNRVSGLSGVQTHITDGRNLLLLTKRRYDIISIEITSIWFAGAASLYNREFYQLARGKMTSGGVIQQWVQLHHMAPTDLLTIISTLRSEFAFVSLYVVGGQGILIATNDVARSHVSARALAALDGELRLHHVRDLAGRDFSSMSKDLLLDPQKVDLWIKRVGVDHSLWISNDNNLRLEYSTPKSNAGLQDRSFEVNMKLLTSVL